MKSKLGIKGRFKIEIRDKDGKLKSSSKWSSNTITNTGLAGVAGLIGNTGTITAFTYLAVGTDSTAPAASQSALIAEIVDTGLARAAATISRVTTNHTNDTLQLVYTWTASGSKTVQETGVFNDPTAGVMLGRGLTGSRVLTNLDTLTVTYQIVT